MWWQLKLWHSSNFNPGFPFTPLDQMITVLLFGFARGFYPAPDVWSALPIIFLTLAGVWMGDSLIDSGRVSHRLEPLAWLALWLLFPVLALFAISLRVPLFTDRYLIWIAPALWILVALGVVALRNYSRWIALLALGSVIALNLLATNFQTHTFIKSDFRQAAAMVERQRSPGDVIMLMMPYVRYTYAYYAGNDFPLIEPPYTNAGATPAQVDAEMRQRLAGWRGVWLVSSEEEAWDRRGLVRAWLEAHGQPTVQQSFVRVEVVHYRLHQDDEG